MENDKTAAQKNGDRPATGYSTGSYVNRGITKREHFAAQIMAGRMGNKIFTGLPMKEHARVSVIAADELLKALEIKTPEKNG